MLNNYYTIVSVSRYLNECFTGYFILDIFSQEKNKLLFEIKKEVSDADSEILEFSVDRNRNYLICKTFFSKAKKNYADIFTEVYGG
ncbi:MAG TPA: hypothetical protein PKD83_09275, partial [Ignavibacteria bacterium]|nr:hypothetical protein [Ignavibacteria bacterium]